MLMLVSLLKYLNNMTSCTPLDKSILNPDHEIESIDIFHLFEMQRIIVHHKCHIYIYIYIYFKKNYLF
jgi:hypothetical protein